MTDGDKALTEFLKSQENKWRLTRIAPELLSAAKALRTAQRAYMADRGNQALGKSVAKAAAALDAVIDKAENA